MYRVVYRDYEGGPAYEFSRHHSKEAAKREMDRASKDPYWKDHIFSVEFRAKPEDEWKPVKLSCQEWQVRHIEIDSDDHAQQQIYGGGPDGFLD